MGISDAESTGAWVNLAQVCRVIEAAVEQRLEAKAALSWSELEVLMRIAIAPGRRLRMAEIAGQLLASKSGVTRLVDRLVADGLISRETPSDNRRVVYGEITEAGLSALSSGRAVLVDGLRESFSRHLSANEMRQLRRILRRLLEGNGAWEEDRCLPDFDEPAGLSA